MTSACTAPGGMAAAGDRIELRPHQTVITITDRDSRTVTVSTWTDHLGVGQFLKDMLGEPAGQFTASLDGGPS